MERRVALAIILAIGVLFLTPRLFPPAPRPTVLPPPSSPSDSAVPTRAQPTTPEHEDTGSARSTARIASDSAAQQRVSEPRTVTAHDAVYSYQSRGASLDRVLLRGYPALNGSQESVVLKELHGPLLSYSVITAGDTISLQSVFFEESTENSALKYEATVSARRISLSYELDSARFLTRVRGTISDDAAENDNDGYIIIDLPNTLESFEANPADDRRSLAVVHRPAQRGASQLGLGSLDPNETEIVGGPVSWVAIKSKYFLFGVLAADSTRHFAEAQVTGLPVGSEGYPRARTRVIQQLRDGTFAFDVYAGPQDWDALQAAGRDFGSANLYGGWLQPVVQPFATIVMRVLLWMHRTLDLRYGWVLLLFGVLVRIAMWPLNQTAMRSGLKVQEIQPLLADVQKRHKGDPQRLSAETMRIYRERGMSPFSPLAGCFPILLSMPVLFALFFVFQSTIEFRGVPFLWLGDISLKDPFYIAPLLMGSSMFLTSWLSMRSAPPNPQTRIMTYVLPVMMTVFLLNMASGLNLYWAAQNIASLPQQWLIIRERARARAQQKK